MLNKIPRIECILTIPELNYNLINEIISNYKLTKSLKILKKKKYRIKLINYINNLDNITDIIEKIINLDDNNLLNFLNSNDFYNITSKIVDNINLLINKYIKILIHIDDQIFVISKLNNDSNKIFLKFFLPKIINNLNNKTFDENINSNKDNIHATILPTLINHGIDGIFHITFRIEGKKKSLFEYTKFCSLNKNSNNLAVLFYLDEKCVNSILFKLTSKLDEIKENIINNNINEINFDSNYIDLLNYITIDIINNMIEENKILEFFERYFYSLGKKTIKIIIDKIFKIIIFTFVELCI